MKRKIPIAVFSLLLSAMLLMCSGCNLPTYIVTDADAPDVTFSNFVAALKSGDYEKADGFLADNASIRPVNSTGYSFFDEYVSVSLKYFDCADISQPAVDGFDATLDATLTTLDKKPLLKWLQDNLTNIEQDYMIKNGLRTIDTEDSKEVDDVMISALKEYEANATTVSQTITVRFVLQDDQWKIIGDENLVAAVFGGVSDEAE